MSSYNPNGIAVGDTVRINAYKHQTMYQDWIDGWGSEHDGVVLRIYKDSSWRSEANMAQVRFLEPDGSEASTASRPLEKLTLVTKGNGTVEPGVTYRYSARELKDQRWAAYTLRAESVDLRHQGYRNAATYLAWLYLNQEKATHQTVPGLRRKDGTINPSKIEKLFYQLRLKVDDWAFECPVDVPAEFTSYPNPVARKQHVDWAEVAEQFTEANIR